MDYLQYTFYVALLLFWVRLWSRPTQEFYFNPILSGTVRAVDAILAFLRPVLFLPEQAAALVVLLFILCFKTLLCWRLGVPWEIVSGTAFKIVPSLTRESFLPLLRFDLAQCAVFLLRLWTAWLLVKLITPAGRSSRAIEAFSFFCRPFSRLPLWVQPLALAAASLLLAFVLTRAPGHTVLPALAVVPTPGAQLAAPHGNIFTAGPWHAQALKTGWLAALMLLDGLMFLTRGLFMLIIGNLIAALLRAQGTMVICGECVAMLLGRFARQTRGTMGFDFTPLIFFFVADFIHRTAGAMLFQLIHHPLLN